MQVFKAWPQHLCQRDTPSEASVSFFMPVISVYFVLYSSSQSSTSCGAQSMLKSGRDTDTPARHALGQFERPVQELFEG